MNNSLHNIAKPLATVLLLCSLACFFPALSKPVLSLNVSLDFSALRLPIPGRHTLMDGTIGILDAIRLLFERGYTVLATLLLLMAVVLPPANILGQGLSLWIADGQLRKWLDRTGAALSRWALAEVFVVSLLLSCYLMEAQKLVSANLEAGFYWYLAHCLTALAASTLAGLAQTAASSDSSPN